MTTQHNNLGEIASPTNTAVRCFAIMAIAMGFLLYKYLLQIFPTVMTESLMKTYHLSGLGMGNLAACYFYGYFLMQLIAGPMLDRFGLRRLTTIAMAVATLGMFVFTIADTLLIAAIGRVFMGIGVAFGTICYLKASDMHCPSRWHGLAGGLLTVGVMLGAFFATAPLAYSNQHWGTQSTLLAVSAVGAVLALTAWFVFPKRQGNLAAAASATLWQHLSKIIKRKDNWLLAAYSGFAFAPLAVLGGLWGTPYLHAAYGISTTTAAGYISLIFIGFGLGGPLFGYIADRKGCHVACMSWGLILSAVALLAILAAPALSLSCMQVALIAFGLGTGGFMQGFTVAKAGHSPYLAATVVGFINSGDALLGSISEPLIGKALDLAHHGAETTHFSLHAFHFALPLLFVYLLAAGYFLWRWSLASKSRQILESNNQVETIACDLVAH